VDFKVVGFGRLLDIVDLCLASMDIAGWYDDVSVVGERHKFISWRYGIEICRVNDVCCWSDSGPLNDTGCYFCHR